MQLFAPDPAANLLPCDGITLYHGRIFTLAKADRYLIALTNTLAWTHDEVVLYGRRITTARKVAWYGDAPYAYTYSGATKTALPWTPELREIKALIEKATGTTYNSCLANLYHTGEEGMGWHSDDEKVMGKNTSIASISLGAERKFAFKHKTRPALGTVSLLLEHGSLLEMKGSTQSHWLHRLPPTKKVSEPRVNLTFRTFVEPGKNG
jgi:alkylated DNA repair dioxygenase AlkB